MKSKFRFFKVYSQLLIDYSWGTFNNNEMSSYSLRNSSS